MVLSILTNCGATCIGDWHQSALTVVQILCKIAQNYVVLRKRPTVSPIVPVGERNTAFSELDIRDLLVFLPDEPSV